MIFHNNDLLARDIYTHFHLGPWVGREGAGVRECDSFRVSFFDDFSDAIQALAQSMGMDFKTV